jgi:hypothetical protein
MPTTYSYRITRGSNGVKDERNEHHIVVGFELLVFEPSEDGSKDRHAACEGGQQSGSVHNRIVVEGCVHSLDIR